MYNDVFEMSVLPKLYFCTGGLYRLFLYYHIKIFTWMSNLLYPSFLCHACDYLNSICCSNLTIVT